MVNIKIASWNVEGRLSNTTSTKRGNANQIIANIKKINADVLVLLEAHSELSLKELKSYQELIDMGYHVCNVPYEDDLSSRDDTYSEQLSLILLSKLKITKVEIFKLGKLRNCVVAIIEIDSTHFIRVIGIHLDDRSEKTRLSQIGDLLAIIDDQSKIPTVVLGDYNAMHGEDKWPSKFLRSKTIKTLAKFVLPSISTRAVRMASGKTLQLLETNTNLVDADKKHRPTATPKIRGHEWLPSIKFIQIDHIFVSKNISVNNYTVANDGGSDHRAISADLFIN